MAGSGLQIRIDAHQLTAIANRFEGVKAKMPAVLNQAVMTIGPIATTAMKGALPGQTGLKSKTINRALHGSGTGGVYVIKSKGGDIRLKYFGPRETSRGVTAAPWNDRRLYPATFIKSGWWPKRVAPIARGQVLRRKSASKYPMEVVRSGLFIAEEMIKGPSAAAFYGTIDARFAPAISAVLTASF